MSCITITREREKNIYKRERVPYVVHLISTDGFKCRFVRGLRRLSNPIWGHSCWRQAFYDNFAHNCWNINDTLGEGNTMYLSERGDSIKDTWITAEFKVTCIIEYSSYCYQFESHIVCYIQPLSCLCLPAIHNQRQYLANFHWRPVPLWQA